MTITTLFAYACSQPVSQPEDISKNASAMRGRNIAARWCRSCHQLPDPSLLTKNIWRDKVLPYMGLRMGFYSPAADSFVINNAIADTSIYPSRKLINDKAWEDIIQYYVSNAPDTMEPQPKHELADENATFFKPEFVNITNEKPAVCFVKIDTLQKPRQIVFANAFKKIFRLNSDHEILDFLQVPGPVVDMTWTGVKKIYTSIGSIDPSTEMSGSVGYFSMDAGGRPAFNILFDSLYRPVQTLACDLNNDNETDYIICEFGKDKGALSWMENKKAGNYQKHSLIDLPGAVKAIVTDADKDGLPDIYALITQGNESIWLLTNKGDGTFDAQMVLQFPAVYGSVSFELNDFNNDGFPDILYACGDNADITQVLKPYHGIYIFTNDKANHFMQSYFYPMYGCYKAMSSDFDGDGNVDIAAISFFADYVNHPEEGFVYLSNRSNNHFKPYSIAETAKGRWLCMDIGDIDGDKKPDIVLGNMAAPLQGESTSRWTDSVHLLVLKNKMK